MFQINAVQGFRVWRDFKPEVSYAPTDVMELYKVRQFQRFAELRKDFKKLAERYQRAEDYCERQDLLKQSRKILEEAAMLSRSLHLELSLLHSRRDRASQWKP